jgi:hypothetical protein
MPIVKKPDGVAKSLSVFPSVSASVAKLLAEGPRDELSSSSKDTPKGASAPPAPLEKGKPKAKGKNTEKKNFCRRFRAEAGKEDNQREET